MLGAQLKDEGFKFLALHPGWVDTDMCALCCIVMSHAPRACDALAVSYANSQTL